jgi:hypothetical protein
MFTTLENLNVRKHINGAKKNFKRASKSQLKRVNICMNGSSINHVLMKNV